MRKINSNRLYAIKETLTPARFDSIREGDEFVATDGHRWTMGRDGAGKKMVLGMTGEFKGKLIYPNHFWDGTMVYSISSEILFDEFTKS